MQLLNPKSDFESLRISEYETVAAHRSENSSLSLRTLDLLLVLAIGIFMCIYNLGAGSFGSGDQTTHSLVVQQMHHTGNYLHPEYDGRPYFNKPPFKMWLATLPVWLLGESTFSYRIVDGICGVGIALCVFFFSLSLFSSRVIAYCSVFALYSARVLFFGHGIRNAVQDTMMLFLMSLGTIAGWFFLERLRKDPFPKLWSLAILGGLTVGLSVLTKNVAGFMAFIILGSYLILSGKVVSVVRRSWKQLLTIAAISFALPAVYILIQGKYVKLAYQMLVITEVFKRATKGYHFVNHKWYYWNAIVHDRVAVQPELLFLGLLFGLYCVLRNRDRRYLFLICWAFVPVLVQNAMKSKLAWYILPAIPGMALLAGSLIGSIFLAAGPEIKRVLFLGLPPRLKGIALIAAGLAVSGSTAYQFASLARDIAGPQRRNATDEMVADILAYGRKHGKTVQALLHEGPRLANHERLYWNMRPITLTRINDFAEFSAKLRNGSSDFVLTSVEKLPHILPLRPITAYSLLPARNKRRQWLVVLDYSDELLPRNFVPATLTYRFADAPPDLDFGFGRVGQINSVRFRPNAGETSALTLTGDIPQTLVGTKMVLSLASLIPTAKGRLSIDVFLNGKLVTELKDIEEGFHPREFRIPATFWRNGDNQLLFQYRLPNALPVAAEQQVVFFEKLSVHLSAEG